MTKRKSAPEGTQGVQSTIADWEELDVEKSRSSQQSRTFSALGYPDSLSADWQMRLDDLHVAIAISPLHNRDVNPSTGELKKPHYHVVLVFEGRKAVRQVEDMLDGTGLVRVRIEPSLHGVLRYLCHLDNACDARDGRHRYSTEDIITLGPLDIEHYLAAKHGERTRAIREMRDWIRENDVYQLGDFLDHVDAERPDWQALLAERGTQFQMEQFLRARYRESLQLDSGAVPLARIDRLEETVANLERRLIETNNKE